MGKFTTDWIIEELRAVDETKWSPTPFKLNRPAPTEMSGRAINFEDTDTSEPGFIFEKLFNEELRNQIVDQTNLYYRQHVRGSIPCYSCEIVFKLPTISYSVHSNQINDSQMEGQEIF